MSKNRDYMSLGDAIDLFLKKNHLSEQAQAQRIIADWAEIMGQAVASNTDKLWFHSGVFYIKVSSAVWRNELAMGRTTILNTLNKYVGEALIKEIRVL